MGEYKGEVITVAGGTNRPDLLELAREKDIKVYRGDRKEVIFSDSAIRIVQDGDVTFEASEATWAIQDTYSLKPDMLRHTREAADVPEEAKKQYIKLLEAEILSAEGGEINLTPSYDETTSPTLSESIDAAFHAEGHHLALTANYLGKVWSE